MEQARRKEAGVDVAGWVDLRRPDRAGSVSAPSAATRFPMWPGGPAFSWHARSVEQQ